MTPLFKIGQEVQVNSTTAIEYLLGRGYTTKGIVHRFTSYRNIRDELVTSYIVKFTNGNKYTKYAVKEAHLQTVVEDNTFNSQAEIWEYLLFGGIIQYIHSGNTFTIEEGKLVCINNPNALVAANFSNYMNYIKYTESAKWYDNIPKSGILCWVSDNDSNKKTIMGTICKGTPDTKFKTDGNFTWKYATPVTQEEVNKLIYQGDTTDTPYTYKKGDFFTVVELKGSSDKSFRGDCFEVIVVDGQFLRAKNHSCKYLDLITIDTDAYVLKPLSDEYVKSFTRNH